MPYPALNIFAEALIGVGLFGGLVSLSQIKGLEAGRAFSDDWRVFLWRLSHPYESKSDAVANSDRLGAFLLASICAGADSLLRHGNRI